jgi:hypothetical protein
MSQLQPVNHWICPANIQWVRDAQQILLVDERSGQVHALQGVDAAIWSWLALAYPYPKVIGFLSLLLGVPVGEAEQRLATILQAWREAGLLDAEEVSGG